MPHVHKVNVSNGGVPKLPVESAYVDFDGVEGDDQADKKHHGGPDQALCLYSLEVIESLQLEGHPISPGNAGENLTLSGVEWADVAPGQRYQVGDDLRFEVTFPATPCSKNAEWFLDRDFRRMSQDEHPGFSRWYARVIEPGTVAEGDPVELID